MKGKLPLNEDPVNMKGKTARKNGQSLEDIYKKELEAANKKEKDLELRIAIAKENANENKTKFDKLFKNRDIFNGHFKQYLNLGNSYSGNEKEIMDKFDEAVENVAEGKDINFVRNSKRNYFIDLIIDKGPDLNPSNFPLPNIPQLNYVYEQKSFEDFVLDNLFPESNDDNEPSTGGKRRTRRRTRRRKQRSNKKRTNKKKNKTRMKKRKTTKRRTNKRRRKR